MQDQRKLKRAVQSELRREAADLEDTGDERLSPSVDDVEQFRKLLVRFETLMKTPAVGVNMEEECSSTTCRKVLQAGDAYRFAFPSGELKAAAILMRHLAFRACI
jgi:hypothetical protein